MPRKSHLGIHLSRRQATGLLLGSAMTGALPRLTLGSADDKRFELFVGTGVDSLQNEQRANVLARDEHVPHQPMMTVEQSADIITNYSQLREFVQVQASGKARIGGVTYSGSASFIDSKESRAYGVCVAIRAMAVTSVAAVKDRVLSDDFIRDKRNSTEQQFFAKYGDVYIDSVDYGGECLILLRYDSSSRSRQRSWAAEIQAKAGTQKGSASFLRTVSELSQTKQLKIRTLYAGLTKSPPLGGGQTFGDAKVAEGNVDIGEMVRWLEAFGENVRKDGVQVPIQITLASFRRARGWQVTDEPLDLSDVRARIDRLTNQRNQIIGRIESWNEFLNDPYYFSDAYRPSGQRQPGEEELKSKAQEQLTALQNVLPLIEQDLACLKMSPIASARAGACNRKVPLIIPAEPAVLRLTVPTVSFKLYRVKRVRHSGDGRAPEESGTTQVSYFEPGKDNHCDPKLENNWLVKSGDTLEIVRLAVWLNPALSREDLRLLVKYNDHEWVEAAPDRFVVEGEELLTSIAFKLEGRLAHAYFLEYQGFAGNRNCETNIAGNTERSSNPPGTALKKSWRMESLRLAIWPKVWPATNTERA